MCAGNLPLPRWAYATSATGRPFRSRQADKMDGAASYGTVIKHYCEECAPKSRAQKDAEVPQLSKKQVKNLMRSAKKGLL